LDKKGSRESILQTNQKIPMTIFSSNWCSFFKSPIKIFLFLICVNTIFAQINPGGKIMKVPDYTYIIVNKIPHDFKAYTQGLVYSEGFLYESTGLRGQSSLRKVNPEDGAVIAFHSLADEFFGEGITILDDKIYQLTWQSYTGFIYDKSTFLLMQEFFYNTEGWGITHNGKELIVSDGSSTLFFFDPATFEILRKVNVADENGPVENLNELEYVNGEIFANILYSSKIARIDPNNGKIVGYIDLTGILSNEKINYPIDVMNGIAYDCEGDRLFITGKLWPFVYEIRVIKKAD
jgi:glutamine cyclotransferase